MENKEININRMAFDLLAQVCEVDKDELTIALSKIKDYRSIIISKRNGEKRELFAPADEVNSIQEQILKKFLYKFIQKKIRKEPYCFVDLDEYINPNLTGFIPGKSYVTNSIVHTKFRSHYILKLDLKNAFPSVSIKNIEDILRRDFLYEIENYGTAYQARKQFVKILQIGKNLQAEFGLPPSEKIELKSWKFCAGNRLKELLKKEKENKIGYFDHPAERDFSILTAWDVVNLRPFNWKKYYPPYPLFPNDKCTDFRKFIREEKKGYELKYSQKIIDEFVNMIVSLVTFNGVLPQGAATSGFLFNLVLSEFGIVNEIERFLINNAFKHSISVYADDIVIGLNSEPSKITIQSIIRIIEKNGVFRVNHNKTKVFKRSSVAPPITGFKLVRRPAKEQELDDDIRSQVSGAKKRKEKGGVWYVDRISLPKKVQKKIRGLIHHAILNEVDEKFHFKIFGYLGMVVQAYGHSLTNIPNQLSQPIRIYGQKYDKLKNFTD